MWANVDSGGFIAHIVGSYARACYVTFRTLVAAGGSTEPSLA
jgi:hypothetical protein